MAREAAMTGDIVERMKMALRPFAALADKRSGVGNYTLVHVSLLDEARSVLAEADQPKEGAPQVLPPASAN